MTITNPATAVNGHEGTNEEAASTVPEHAGMESAETLTGELMLPVEELIAHPYNVRADLGELDGLVVSIRQYGVLEPITVTRLPDGGWGVIFDSRHLHNRKVPSTRYYVVHRVPNDAVVTRSDASTPATQGLSRRISDISGE